MKKIILSFVMLLCSMMLSAQTYVYSVARDGYTNIRSSYSTNSRIIGEMRNGGGSAVYMHQTGNWYKVNYRGVVGYVHKSQVRLSSATSRNTTNYGGGRSVYSVAPDGYTNIRKGPSTNNRIIGEIRNGAGSATYLSTSGNWYRVNYRGIVGYVHKSQVRLR